MATGDVKIVILAQDQASKTIQLVGDKMQSSLNKVSAAAAIAGAGLAAFAGKAISDFSEAEAAQKQLEHATLEVAHGTREQLKALQDLSVELEKKGVLDGDSIATGLAQLQTFGLSSDMVKELGGSLADLAVNQYGVNASSEQLTESANMIAKALNGQFGILEKSGIRFTDAQKALIQYGSETEKATALQEGFAQNLKYTNEVAKQTTEGSMAALKVQLGNISESIGGALAPALAKLVTNITPIIQKIGDWAAQNPELISKIILITGVVLGFVAVLAPLVSAIGAVSTAFFFLAANPIILVIAAIVALGVAIAYLIANWDNVGSKVSEVWNGIVTVVSTFAGQVSEKIGAFAGQVIAFFTTMWDGAKEIFMAGIYFVIGIIDILSSAILGVSLPQLITGFQMGWQLLVDTVTGLAQAMSDVVLGIWEGIKIAASGLFTAILAIISTFTEPITTAWTAIWNGLTDAFNTVSESIKAPIQSVFDWIKEKLDAIKSAAEGIGKAISGFASGVISKGKSAVSKITGKKASGGSVMSGGSYLVGENGPEIFKPYTGGTIIPNGRSSGGIGGINVNVNVGKVSSDIDVREMARVVGDQIMRTLKQNQLLGA